MRMVRFSGISLLVVIAFMLFMSSCNSGPVFPVVPEISFINISPQSVSNTNPNAEFIITIHFQDGDGDLGSFDTGENSENLFIKDTRENIPEEFRTESFTIPDLSPDTRKPSIQGTIEIAIEVPPQLSKNFPPFIGPGSEEVFYEIYLMDRAGHHSNIITTSAITITP